MTVLAGGSAGSGDDIRNLSARREIVKRRLALLRLLVQALPGSVDTQVKIGLAEGQLRELEDAIDAAILTECPQTATTTEP